MEPAIDQYFDEFVSTLRAVEVADGEGAGIPFNAGIAAAVRILRGIKSAGKKVMLIGNGGSAAIASHYGLDFWHAGGLRSMAFNDGAQLSCLANDHGTASIFARPVEMFADAGDGLIAISSSGRSANILNGVEAARAKHCRAITFSGFDADNPLRGLGDVNFYVPAAHYGYVETLHHVLIHSLLDALNL